MFGCKELRRLREEVAAFAAGFDADLVDTTEALVMLNEAATMEKISATIMAMAAARIDDTNCTPTTPWADLGLPPGAGSLGRGRPSFM